ncbi:hypothetical protein [Nocardioides sp. AE5]|uniref:hypothetical protein n=1 Tax=Nocardioides sp. AE5 TaxID=2962573 RepID=UPI0028829405|nr:hypothetical protein [Nocardioides sp. AE5]MDT0201391.1 hypothetical protein [Nocardioides sp. AE5]
MHDYLDEWEANVDSLAVATTRVCSTCVVDMELWRRVGAATTLGRCDFCGTTSDITSFDDLTAGITALFTSSTSPSTNRAPITRRANGANVSRTFRRSLKNGSTTLSKIP